MPDEFFKDSHMSPSQSLWWKRTEISDQHIGRDLSKSPFGIEPHVHLKVFLLSMIFAVAHRS